MITLMKKQLRGTVYKFLLWGFLIALGLGSLPAFVRRSTGSTWAMRVNANEISGMEYNREVVRQQDYVAHLRAQYGQYVDLILQSMGEHANPKMLAFDALVREELLNQVADKLGLNLHQDYVVHQLVDPLFIYKNLAGYVPANSVDALGINQMMLQSYLKRIGVSMADFERKVERVIARNVVLDLVTIADYVPNFVVKQRYLAHNAHKKFSLLIFQEDEYLKKAQKEVVSESDIQAFFEAQNKQANRYLIPEKRFGVAWRIMPESYGITIDEAAMTSYYENNKNSMFVKSPAQVQVRRILLKDIADEGAQQVYADLLKEPQTFAEAARALSADEDTKKNGGLLPFFAKGSNEYEFERAAFLLQEIGDIAQPIRTEKGIEIIQLVDKKSKVLKSFDEVKSEIKQKLIAQTFKEKLAQEVQTIAQQEAQNPGMLQQFIKQKAGKKAEISGTEKTEALESGALFALEPQGIGYYFEDGAGFVVQLTAVEKAHLPLLKDIKDQVTRDLYINKAHTMLYKDIEEARKKAYTTPFEQLAEEYNVSLLTTDWVTPDEKKLPSMLSKLGITNQLLTQLDTKGAIIPHWSKEQEDGILVRLDEISSGTQEEYMDVYSGLYAELNTERSHILSEGFVASLYRNATIDTNESLFAAQA